MKMIQSDTHTLSQRPDLCQDNEEPELVTMLPETLFVSLIDTELQEQIINSEKHDEEATGPLETLLEEGPNDLKHDLKDWTMEEKDGKKMLFVSDC